MKRTFINFIETNYSWIVEKCKFLLWALHYYADENAAADIAHEVILKLSKSAKFAELLVEGDEDQIAAFTYVVLRNTCIDFVKGKSKNPITPSSNDPFDLMQNLFDSGADDVDRKHRLPELFGQLRKYLARTQRERVVELFELHFVKGIQRGVIVETFPWWTANRYDEVLKKLKRAIREFSRLHPGAFDL